MKRPLLLLVTLAYSTSLLAQTTPPAPPPCNPGHTIVNATLWMQSSAEYRANALQAYATAQRMLDAALADPSWVAAEEQTSPAYSLPPAIVLDLDETSVDNSRFEAQMILKGKTYDSTDWVNWTQQVSAPVPGALEFLLYAKSRGVTPFYITNRKAGKERDGTLANIQKLGFPVDATGTTLLTQVQPSPEGKDKSPRRGEVAKKYRILLVLGDDLNDFTRAFDKSADERNKIVGRHMSDWGKKWIILPNPIYGSWENAIFGEAKDCEAMELKIKALVP